LKVKEPLDLDIGKTNQVQGIITSKYIKNHHFKVYFKHFKELLWQRNMDLRFLCEKGVHCCYLGVKNYLLFCHIIMHESISDEEVLC
jgi:hypothetical protein